jgi:hypothetical protein
MADFKGKAGSFLPYLEASRQRQDPAAAPSGRVSPLTLLAILARQAQHSLPMFDLQTLGGMEAQRYAEALKRVKDSGWVEISGDAPEQVVKLTDSGLKVVEANKPL